MLLTPVFKDELATYGIVYDLNGGALPEGGFIPSSYQYSKTASISLPKPERTGYSFLGWYNTVTNKKISSIAKGMTGNLHIEARWKANKYTVKFNTNGGNGSMSSQAMIYDQDALLNANKFKRVHHSFVEWNTAADGSGIAYTADTAYSNLCASGTIVLYAIWEEDPKQTYSISIDAVCDDYNHVGYNWEVEYQCDSQAIGDNYVITSYEGENVQITVKISERDQYSESGKAVFAVKLVDGFVLSKTIKVTENADRYKGYSALWNVTIRVN